MARYCFVSQIDPAHLDAYRARHAEVWPEMLRALADSGWSNYSLFLSPAGMLVGYVESENIELAQARMSALEVNARWQKEMSELFTGDGNPDEGFVYLEEVFNLEDQLAKVTS